MVADPKPLVIVADDCPDVLALLMNRITAWGYRVAPARTKAELFARLSAECPAVVLLDLRFGDADGLEVLRQVNDMAPDLPVALLTGHGSVELAVAAMRLGAYDFVTKSADLAPLRGVLGRAVERQRLAVRGRKPDVASAGVRLLGESPAMRSAVDLIRGVAPTDATVLVLGESGTGKELVARTLHELSPRAAGPFIALNAAALPRDLAESLLFGHEKGAFTGADKAQLGACELADGGTLFLDEIGEMDPALQAKLLRFLQERTVQRVGNPKANPVDVRVVAATNRDLAERVRAGHFREDLYYRLNVVPLRVPPLRDRREDVPLLAAGFLAKAARKYGRPDLHFTPDAVAALAGYDWPGNVRQLENVIERLAILSAGPAIGPEAFADEFRTNLSLTTTPPPRQTPAAAWAAHQGQTHTPPNITTPPPRGADGLRLVDQIERQTIVDALAHAAGSVREASHVLGLSQATVYRKIKRYGLAAG